MWGPSQQSDIQVGLPDIQEDLPDVQGAQSFILKMCLGLADMIAKSAWQYVHKNSNVYNIRGCPMSIDGIPQPL